ncbi:nucleotide-binding domain-containing protein [Hymenopellis radicata]|nr:nucleotide-binding domain-containing protein [Hymenopellis radicata]
MSLSSAPDFFLTRVGDELAIRQGRPTMPSPDTPKKRILVVGGGVTGFTTAWALLDAGYDVTIVAERWADPKNRITSQIAGALWEFPPAVCGKHTDVISLHNSKRWCMTAYRAFDKLQEIMPRDDYLDHGKMEDMPDRGQLDKFEEIMAQKDIKGVRRDANIVHEHEVNQKAGVVDAYQHLAPVIDTDAYMHWLRFVLVCKGAVMETRRINGDLLDQEEELLAEYGADAIVNATGLAGLELAGDDSVYPLRGALIRVVNDGTKFPKVTEALAVTHDDTRGEDEDIVFIPEIIRMRQRCNNFVPGLEHAEYDPDTPLVQGLRPFRGSNVRVERELRPRSDRSSSRIVHSYGQGGAGFSLSFGCASDVLELIEEMEKGLPAMKMSCRRRMGEAFA